MKKPILFLCLIFLFTLFVSPMAQNKTFGVTKSEDLKLSAKSALLVDYDSNTVIYEKNANERLPIASMTKIASLSVIFDAIEKGAIKENDMIIVSENASKVGGSSAFLDAGSSYKVSDLIKTVVIASANDSCVALAEHIAGSEEVFVTKMNKQVESLGLKNTHFENSTGLPIENHYSSAYDICEIYRLICNNSLFKKYSRIWMEDYIHPSGRKTGLVNTNRLIKTFDGIEGGKTGYTDSSKFCLTASASRGSTRLIGVVIGVNDSKTRFAEMTTMFNYGFSNFESRLVVNSEIPVTISKVNKSKQELKIFPERNSQIFLNKNDNKEFTTDYKLDEISAPVEKGRVIGKMFVFDNNNMVVDEINLVAGESIEKENFKDILNRIINIW